MTPVAQWKSPVMGTAVRFRPGVLEFCGVLEEIMNMASFNRVVLLGNLTRDVELRMIGSGTAVCDLGLAVNDRFKNKVGEWVDEPTFVDVTLWGRTAEIASEYLSKGSQVLIEGRLKLETWEKDGQKRSKLKVIGEKLQLLGQKGQRQTVADDEPAGAASSREDRGYDRDEIPF